MKPEIETYIVENLPTSEVCPNGYSPKLVCDWLRQTMYSSELHKHTDKQLYRMVYSTLRKLREAGRIDAAYGIGDNGQMALTYNSF